MAETVTLTLSFPHHDWIRIRAFALAKRQTLDDLVTDALREGLHRLGYDAALPQPETFSERLTAIATLLAQTDALTAAFTAALHDPTIADKTPDDPQAKRGSILRESHVRLLPDTRLTIRPKVPIRIWQRFKGYAFVHGRNPMEAVISEILTLIGTQLLNASQPDRPAPIAAALTEVIEGLTALRREMDEADFQF